MDDDSSRLVDDEQVLVLVRDPELPLLRIEAAVNPIWNLDLEVLAALEPVAFGPRLTVYADGPRREQALGLRARADLGERGDEAVKPLSAGFARD